MKITNWRTLAAGVIAGLPTAIDALVTAYNAGTFTGKSGAQLFIGVGIVLFGVYAKDKNVTGGTIPNTPSKASVVQETSETNQ